MRISEPVANSIFDLLNNYRESPGRIQIPQHQAAGSTVWGLGPRLLLNVVVDPHLTLLSLHF
jgi:hypothetical protein